MSSQMPAWMVKLEWGKGQILGRSPPSEGTLLRYRDWKAGDALAILASMVLVYLGWTFWSSSSLTSLVAWTFAGISVIWGSVSHYSVGRGRVLYAVPVVVSLGLFAVISVAMVAMNYQEIVILALAFLASLGVMWLTSEPSVSGVMMHPFWGFFLSFIVFVGLGYVLAPNLNVPFLMAFVTFLAGFFMGTVAADTLLGSGSARTSWGACVVGYNGGVDALYFSILIMAAVTILSMVHGGIG